MRPAEADDSGRDDAGRFAIGNKLGRGNPLHRRLNALRRAARRSVRPPDVRAMMLKMLELALEGDVQAARLWAEYALGRPRAMPADLALDLPALRTPSDVVLASSEIVRAVTRGEVSAEDGARIGGLVEVLRRAVETEGLAGRVEALERQLGGPTR